MRRPWWRCGNADGQIDADIAVDHLHVSRRLPCCERAAAIGLGVDEQRRRT